MLALVLAISRAMARIETAAGLANLPLERFNAVDTRSSRSLETLSSQIDGSALASLQATVARGYRTSHAQLTFGAVGCALSHVGVSRESRKRGLAVCAVFEDDASLPTDLLPRIQASLNAAPAAWDCVLLGWSGARPSTTASLLQPVSKFWGMHAYLLSRAGAHKLERLVLPVRTHIDHALSVAAARGDFNIYGIAAQDQRILQGCRGSDVQLPVRLTRNEPSSGQTNLQHTSGVTATFFPQAAR